MQNRPDLGEIFDALESFLTGEVAPAAEGPLRFRTRVAVNLLGIMRREIETAGDQFTAGEAAALAASIREGAADEGEPRREILGLLRQETLRKLVVDNPRLAATMETEWRGKS